MVSRTACPFCIKPVSIDEVVVCFVAIEKDDNEDTAKDAVSQIQESMKKLGCQKLLLYPYAHLSSNLASPSTALSLLKFMESQSQELDVSRAPFGWTKSYIVKVKGHPLAESSKVITTDSKKEKTSIALESESKIKSYWYIMTPDGNMMEFDKFNFGNHKKLELLAKYESVKKRLLWNQQKIGLEKFHQMLTKNTKKLELSEISI